MSVKPTQRAASDKWDAANMAYQTVKVRKSLLDDFRAACVARGDKVNTVLRQAMENYVSGDQLTVHEWGVLTALLESDLQHCEAAAKNPELSYQQRSDERRCAEMIRPCFEKVSQIHKTLSDGQKRP